MSTGRKWLIGIGVFVALGLIGGVMEAIGGPTETNPPTATTSANAPATSTPSESTTTEASASPTSTWQVPTDGVWALVDYTDPDEVVPFAQTSPGFDNCGLYTEEEDCDRFTVTITEPPDVTETDAGLRVSSQFVIERVNGKGDRQTALDAVDGSFGWSSSFYLEPGFNSYADGWDETTGQSDLDCPAEDVAAGESMTCTISFGRDGDYWLKNACWWLVRDFYFGMWPGQSVPFDPQETAYQHDPPPRD